MTSPRPFEEQSHLERVLRAHLWHPVNALKSAEETLAKAIRDKNYTLAGKCQTSIRESKDGVETFTRLLDLYEKEFYLSKMNDDLA